MNGILLIDKDQDWTSNDVVVKLKGILHERRIGHAGTLDPMATGLVVAFVGRATRGVEFAEEHDKRYTAHLRLGISTDTQDITGNVLEKKPVELAPGALEAVLERFRGPIEQIPPMYSALKHNGQRLYDIARKGGTVDRPPRPVTIHSLELAGMEGEDYVLEVHCSKGTYVRTLCHDIGQALGCGACMSYLRRTQAGAFTLDKAVKLADVQAMADQGRAEELLIPLDSLFPTTASCTASAAQERRIRCGNSVKTDLAPGTYRVYSQQGEFLMLGRVDEGIMKTVKSFFEV